MKPFLRWITIFFVCIFLTTSHLALAWERYGHSLISTTAATLLSGDQKNTFLKSHAYDLGYYSNTPDFIWKRTATYPIEGVQHFMDMEIFRRLIPADQLQSAFAFSRVDFDTRYPAVPLSAGRSWWRIREFDNELIKITNQLKDDKLNHDQRFSLQTRWLLLSGAMGHYIEDLAMPLHTTENHDGEFTNQRGIHSRFEGMAVNALYPQLNSEVFKRAKALWPAYHSANQNKPLLQILEELTDLSYSRIPQLLALDKKIPRDHLQEYVRANQKFIVECLATGSIALAEVWQRHLGWDFDDQKFYNFDAEPAYIYPPGARSTATTSSHK